MSSLNWDYVLKFVIIGDAAVGKSSLLVRLTDQKFLSKPDPTLGVEFGSKLISLADENKTVKLQCWDTAGTESFRSITRSYYRGAAGALLVYDVTSRARRKHREVSRDEAEKFAREEGLLFIEASAKTGENVDRAFEEATRDILHKIRQGVFDDNKSPGVKSTRPRNDPNTLQLEDTRRRGACC
ncbi:Ras protein [Rhizoctonia solani]|uniref:Ras protein n=1 Tax=Rhizoctonia solani TaxID=456999 RepID=A0A8H7M397_9AGAM|nr:Ras protein [Rhizoctonia solani]